MRNLALALWNLQRLHHLPLGNTFFELARHALPFLVNTLVLEPGHKKFLGKSYNKAD